MIEVLNTAGIPVEDRSGRAVALPGDADGVVAVVNEARKARVVVAPWWTDVADAVYISTERLTDITEVVPQDLMAVVGAGVTCSSLADRVECDSLYWPGCDVSEPGAAVGDIVARAQGNWTLAGNVLRRYLLGMEVVLADGRVLHTGSRTVKWVTGYDLRQLFVGSRGTMGIITGLTLRLEPLANRAVVTGRYEREFAGLEKLGDEPWHAAEALDASGPGAHGGIATGAREPSASALYGETATGVAGSLAVLRRLKAELDPTGVFPPAETAFGA